MTRKSKPRRSCRLCKPSKYDGNSKRRDKASVKRRKDAADAQVRDVHR